jgi:2',3'-cyclic-nucleotide 3'-phosphodiesterase
MPGSSLWLLPPADHPLQGILGELIAEVSRRFGSTHLFVPHVTLTSEIEPGVYGGKAGAQKWLNGVEFPDSRDVVVRFGKLQSEDVFVRKLYVTVAKEGVKGIGGVARKFVGGEKEVESWVEERYRPHLSLL